MQVSIVVGHSIDFQQFLPEKQLLDSSTKTTLQIALKFFKILGTRFFQAGYLTLKEVGPSFTYIVSSSLGVTDLYSVFFRIIYWMYSIPVTFIRTLYRLVNEAYNAPCHSFQMSGVNPHLLPFADAGIDLRHLRTKDVSFDDSVVPQSVVLDNLFTLFEKINFRDPNAPGYMPPSTRKEEEHEYTVEELRNGLNEFVANVRNRVARIGTPPGYDRVALHDFYRQIEAAIRLCLHKVVKDLKDFDQKYPLKVNENRDEVEAREYRNVLENQARLVIDLAIAGKYCGARYMGEALSSYLTICEQGEVVCENLENTLIEFLAIERKKLAEQEAFRLFRTNTHGYSKYFEQMKKDLGLPGIEGASEFLLKTFNKQEALASFFKKYNENYIINAIQEKVKKSQRFREQIFDWLKEQIGDWRPEDLISTQEAVKQIQEALSQAVEIENIQLEIEFFKKILASAKEKPNGDLDAIESWPLFVEEVFALGDGEYDHKLGVIERMQKRQTLIQKFSRGILGKALEQNYVSHSKEIVLEEGLKNVLHQLAKVEKMRRILPIHEEVYLRVIEGKAELKDVIENYLKQPIQSQFLEALNLENIVEEGLPPVLLEWLLDSHHIFIPKPNVWVDNSEVDVHPIFAKRYISLVDPENHIFQLKAGNKKAVQHMLEMYVQKRRYIFGTNSDVEALALQMFEEAFQKQPEEIVQLVKTEFSNSLFLSPKWEKMFGLTLPQKGAAVFDNKWFKVFFSIALLIQSIRMTKKVYQQSLYYTNQVKHFCSHHYQKFPPSVTKQFKFAWEVRAWILRNRFKLFFSLVIVQFLIRKIPSPILQRVFSQINPFWLFRQDSYWGQMWDMFIFFVKLGWNLSEGLSNHLKNRVARFKQEEWGKQKELCRSLWMRSVT